MKGNNRKKTSVVNKVITPSFLESRINPVYGKAKWILFCEELLANGFALFLYESKSTVSKYITIIKEGDGRTFKVRFSNHKPAYRREINKDCDFFVGISNTKVTTTEDALKEVYNFFNHENVSN